VFYSCKGEQSPEVFILFVSLTNARNFWVSTINFVHVCFNDFTKRCAWFCISMHHIFIIECAVISFSSTILCKRATSMNFNAEYSTAPSWSLQECCSQWSRNYFKENLQTKIFAINIWFFNKKSIIVCWKRGYFCDASKRIKRRVDSRKANKKASWDWYTHTRRSGARFYQKQANPLSKARVVWCYNKRHLNAFTAFWAGHS
jgi:hypothetical protein